METLIQQCLRRGSHNLAASLEDLVTKSIRDESSTSSSSSNSSSGSSSTGDLSSEEQSDYSKSKRPIAPTTDSGRGEEETGLKKNGAMKRSHKTCIRSKKHYNISRNITLASKNPAASVVPAIKKHKVKGLSKSDRIKKSSESIISLASLEVVEQQLSIITTHCNNSTPSCSKKQAITGGEISAQILTEASDEVDSLECTLTIDNSNNLAADENTEEYLTNTQ